MYGKSLKPFRCSIADQDEGTNEQDNEQKSLEKTAGIPFKIIFSLKLIDNV